MPTGHPPRAGNRGTCRHSAWSFSRNSEERRPTRWMAHGLRWRTTSADRQRCRPSPSWKDRPMARGSGAERWSAGLPPIRNLSGPMQAVGGLFSMSADAVQCRFSAAVSVARVPGAVLVHRSGRVGADTAGGHPVHGAGQLHAQHPAARTRCGRPVRRGCGVRRGDPGRTPRDRADRRGSRLDSDLRGPGVAHHPRRDRRDGSAWHRSCATLGDPAHAGRRVWWRCCSTAWW